MKRIERALLGAFCLIVLSLQVVLYRHAGAFWRDETFTIQSAGLPSFAAMWASLAGDSFPGLFSGLLRLWILAGPGGTDGGVRLFGAVIAAGCAASTLAAFRALTGRIPLVALALTAMNGTIFYFGSSLRAYGLAVLLVAPCFAAVWTVARSPSKRNVFGALVLALLTAHSNYQSGCLLLGLAVAGAAVCALERLWRRSLLILSIGLVAALSMLVYLPIIERHRVLTVMPGTAPEWSAIFLTFAAALGGADPALRALWAALLAAALILPLLRYREDGQRPSLALFSWLALVVGAAAGAVFFRVNKVTPFVWQFSPFIAFAAVAVEIALDPPRPAAWLPAVRAALACAIMGLSWTPVWRAAHLRRTNLDLAAGVLAREAGPDDLIIVASFWLAPGFHRLYRGRARWNTLPFIPIDDETGMMYGARVKKRMGDDYALEPALDQAGRTLRAGHRVWNVAWRDSYSDWSMEFDRFIEGHAARRIQIPVSVDQPVCSLEDVSLSAAEGWR